MTDKGCQGKEFILAYLSRGAVQCSTEDMAAGTAGSCWLCMHTEEEESNEKFCSARTQLFTQWGTTVHGMMLPTLKVCLPSSVSLI